MALRIHKKTNAGFTLMEVMVAIIASTVILLGVVALIQTLYNTSRRGSGALTNVLQSNVIVNNFTNELRNGATGADGSFPLNQAGNGQIVFFSGFGNSGTTVQRIRYYLSGTTLYKGVVVPSGTPAIYDLSSEQVSPVLTNVSNGSTPVFAYYGGSYNGVTDSPLAQPVNVTAVSFVKINLFIIKQAELGTTTYTVSAGAAIRNLKTNLGN